MKIATVVIDSYKLPVFVRILNEAGYNHMVEPGLTKDILLLKVGCEFPHLLQPFIEKANKESKK
jgi:hypothetical protein